MGFRRLEKLVRPSIVAVCAPEPVVRGAVRAVCAAAELFVRANAASAVGSAVAPWFSREERGKYNI